MNKDDCNADGYVNSIYTLGIGSVNEHGVSTYYGEKCAAMIAVTYCSGAHSSNSGGGDPQAVVITTYLHHQCTDSFVGTSSAAPLAAGILALVLEANPMLSWRDVQHLVFQTAVKTSPMDLGWQINGCGKPFNHKFGFGLLDAYELVKKALNWTLVPPQKSCHFKLTFENGYIPSGHHFKLSFTTDGCQSCKFKNDEGKCKNSITKLEHVVVNVTLKHRRRGDLSIDLISPAGTVSHMLHERPYDDATTGLKGWTLMTLFNWCENPKGTWQLLFIDKNASDSFVRNLHDLEDEYIKELDERKKEGSEEKFQRDDENIVQEEDNEYKSTSNEKKSIWSSGFRDAAYQRYLNRKESYGDYYGSRVRRSADENTDGMIHKSDIDKSFDTNSNEILNNSQLAGVVQEISVTFYGT